MERFKLFYSHGAQGGPYQSVEAAENAAMRYILAFPEHLRGELVADIRKQGKSLGWEEVKSVRLAKYTVVLIWLDTVSWQDHHAQTTVWWVTTFDAQRAAVVACMEALKADLGTDDLSSRYEDETLGDIFHVVSVFEGHHRDLWVDEPEPPRSPMDHKIAGYTAKKYGANVQL